MKLHLGIIGAGGFGREIAPFAAESFMKSLGIADPGSIHLCFVVTVQQNANSCNGIPVYSLDDFLSLQGDKYYVLAIADSMVRETIGDQINHRAKAVTLQHRSALVLAENKIAEGAILCPYTVITSNAVIGKHFHANLYSYVAHDCLIGDFVTFAPGVKCNGNVRIEDHVYVGTGAIIKPGSSEHPTVIGRGAIIGMGAVVTKSVAPGTTVVGNPARPILKAT